MLNRKSLPAVAFLLLAGLVLTATAQASIFKKEAPPDQERAEIREMRDATLAQLYKAQPAAKGQIPKAAEVQAGLGFGVKKFRLVWVFEKKSDMARFINSGWELGAQSTASAQVSGQGSPTTVSRWN